jgi:hypothetical protein
MPCGRFAQTAACARDDYYFSFNVVTHICPFYLFLAAITTDRTFLPASAYFLPTLDSMMERICFSPDSDKPTLRPIAM